MPITNTPMTAPPSGPPENAGELDALAGELERMREKLAEMEMLCRTTWEASPDLAFLATRLADGAIDIQPMDEHHVPHDQWGTNPPRPRDLAHQLTQDVRLTNQIALAMLHHSRFEQEWPLVLPEGHETCWIDFTCVPCGEQQAIVVVRNVTDSKQIATSLESWQERYRRLTGELADYIFSVDVENGVPVSTSHTPACEAVTGYTPEEFDVDPYLWINMVLPEHQEDIRRQAADVLQGKKVHPVEHRILRKDGQIRWVRNTSIPYFDQEGRLVAYDGLVQDINERKRALDALEENEELFRTLAEFATDMIFWHDAQSHLRYISPACLTITGYTADEIRDRPELFHRLIHSSQCQQHLDDLQQSKRNVVTHQSEFSYETKNGETRWMRHICRPVYDRRGQYLGLRGSNSDITEQKEAEQKLHDYMDEIKSANLLLELQKDKLQEQQNELMHANKEMRKLTLKLTKSNTELSILARTDPLTRLLNRRAWEEILKHEDARERRHDSPYSIIMIDVDHFKLYNDSHGHQEGDRCLRRVAECISLTCRGQDFVGRYGGEEFVVLATVTDEEQARGLAERIRAAIEGLELEHPQSPIGRHVTVSIGVATHGAEPWEMTIHRADEALYQAKSAGRNRVTALPTPGGSSSSSETS